MADSARIQYNVENVFEEYSREVRKMSIKVNGRSVWMDWNTNESARPGVSNSLNTDDNDAKEQVCCPIC